MAWESCFPQANYRVKREINGCFFPEKHTSTPTLLNSEELTDMGLTTIRYRAVKDNIKFCCRSIFLIYVLKKLQLLVTKQNLCKFLFT